MEHETTIRLGVFLGLLAALIAAETLLPRKIRTQSRTARWTTNFGVTIANTITLYLMAIAMPVMSVAAAYDASTNGFGLLGQVGWPTWVEALIAILVLDFIIWAQHLITHKVPLLWRLHRVHHADRDMDVTTAIRFHPIEIALSMLLKIGVIYLLGPTALAVILFEVMLNGMAMFNHANLRLPLWLDRILRRVIVTPDMHRVHHSVDRAEHDSNYGFSLSIWDQMFGTYIAQPKDGHDEMVVGLQWQDARPAKFSWVMLLPFKRK